MSVHLCPWLNVRNINACRSGSTVPSARLAEKDESDLSEPKTSSRNKYVVFQTSISVNSTSGTVQWEAFFKTARKRGTKIGEWCLGMVLAHLNAGVILVVTA